VVNVMKTSYILPLDDQDVTLEVAGGKGASLARMALARLPIPGGFHVTTAAYRLFVAENDLQARVLSAIDTVEALDPESLEAASRDITAAFLDGSMPADLASQIEQAYAALPGESPAVAVRSSATAEDLPEASFAGQQETYLNVSGAAALLDATRKCWASLWTPRAIGYRARQGIAAEGVALAVVVQLLVPAEVAGILFTANPVNGRRDQMIVNASWGLGEAVVGGLVTPDTLTMDKTTGEILTRETAEKRVQTVRVEGGTAEQHVPENLRQVPVLNDSQAAELAAFGNEIETLYGMPMDIEWTLADGKFAIVQARPITALPKPEPLPPTEWKLPKGAYSAMRNNIVELMADPLTPLFRTLGLGAVNASMNRMMEGFIKVEGLMPDPPIISVNEYAYYNGSVKFGPMLKVILDTRGILRRMFTGAVERWTESGRPRYLVGVNTWQDQDWRQLPPTEILGAVQQLAEAAIDAYGALVSGVIPAAWMSEAWFTFTYRFVRRQGDPPAPVFLMGFDSLPILAEKALYDLAGWVGEDNDLAAYLGETPADQIAAGLGAGGAPAGVGVEVWRGWQERFQGFLDVYGHMIYNLDFANPVPADDPAPLLETFKLFLSGQGVDPHTRQQGSAGRREEAVQAIQKRLKGRRLRSFQKNLARAQKYAPLREDGLADVGLSYPLLRQMLLEIGRRFVEGSMLEQPDDIFWLEGDEVQAAAAQLERGEPLDSLAAVIPERKAVWQAARKVSPPLMLPQIKIFGLDLAELKAGGLKKRKADTLKGVAASPGRVTGPACVVHGPEDFAKMTMGDVLVAPLTTPAWTPLFVRAVAIVTDVGGPLSHGSIVAREYGIPAVLGTGAATTRIRSGQMVTVDGGEGIVTISKNGGSGG
jgi:pyruvate,water dikinase